MKKFSKCVMKITLLVTTICLHSYLNGAELRRNPYPENYANSRNGTYTEEIVNEAEVSYESGVRGAVEVAPGYDDDHVFQSVEQMPQFPGGDAELMKFLSSNIHYPTEAAKKGMQGRVTVQMVIKKDGSVGEVRVVRGKDPLLDAEAVRVVKTLPNFIPGKMNGQPVNVWFTLPVNFKLAN